MRKQLAIWDQLGKNTTMEYAQVCCFLGEIYKDLGDGVQAIVSLEKGIQLHEQAADNHGADGGHESMVSVVGFDQMALERSQIMKILAEEQIKVGQTEDGIRSAKEALVIQ